MEKLVNEIFLQWARIEYHKATGRWPDAGEIAVVSATCTTKKTKPANE